MYENLVERVDRGMCRVLFQLPDLSDQLAIDIMYDFLESMGVEKTRPPAIGMWYTVKNDEKMYASVTKEQVETKEYGGLFIKLQRECDDKGPIQFELSGHPSSEIKLKVDTLAPILEGYLVRKVRESIPPPPPAA
ncbi:hypothetical protein ACFL96_12680 [Thermoproteota archaeon]